MTNNSRRSFIGKVAAAAALSPLSALAGKAAVSEATEPGFLCPPYLQALMPESVVVMAITASASYTWVEFGETDFNRKAFCTHEGLAEANTRLFHMRLKHLKPGTTYQYRVVSKEIVLFHPYNLQYGKEVISETYRFTTPVTHANSVSCLILNDIHDRPASFKPLVALNGDKNYDFVMLNGDMFDFQTDEQQMLDHLLRPLTSLFASRIPFIMNRGNHETRGKFAREFKDYFCYPEHSYYQAYQQGPVYWVMLDTGEDKPDNDKAYAGLANFDAFRIQQAQWLDELAKQSAFKKAPFRVVFMHIPPFHSGDWHGTMHNRELFDPLFRKHKIDLVISGHTHRYGIHLPGAEHPYPMVIGGGPKEGSRTLIRLDANGKQLDLTMWSDDGKEAGKLQLTSKK